MIPPLGIAEYVLFPLLGARVRYTILKGSGFLGIECISIWWRTIRRTTYLAVHRESQGDAYQIVIHELPYSVVTSTGLDVTLMACMYTSKSDIFLCFPTIQKGKLVSMTRIG